MRSPEESVGAWTARPSSTSASNVSRSARRGSFRYLATRSAALCFRRAVGQRAEALVDIAGAAAADAEADDPVA